MLQVTDYLIRSQEKVTDLHAAAGEGNLKAVKRIIEKNQRLVVARARDGSVALHHMAKSGNIAGVRSLHNLYPPAKSIKDSVSIFALHTFRLGSF